MNDELIKAVVEGIIKEYLFEPKTPEIFNKIKEEIAEELRISIESIKITHKNLVDTIHFTVDNKEYIARVSI